jgi:hypothetical protein
MSIDFACPQCGQPLAVGDDQAGREIRCPNCRAGMTVPSVSHPPNAIQIPVSPAAGGRQVEPAWPTVLPGRPASSRRARLGLLMGLGCLILFAGYFLAMGAIALQLWPNWAQAPVGQERTDLERRIAEESVRLAPAFLGMFVGLHVMAVAGLWLSLRAMRERAPHRRPAIAGVILCGLCCLLLLWVWLALFAQIAAAA